MKKITPLGQRVIVRRDEADTKSASGIILIPESAKTKPLTGEIVAVSDDLENKNLEIGKKVMFLKYGGMEIEIDKEDCVVLLYTDIIGIIEE